MKNLSSTTVIMLTIFVVGGFIAIDIAHTKQVKENEQLKVETCQNNRKQLREDILKPFKFILEENKKIVTKYPFLANSYVVTNVESSAQSSIKVYNYTLADNITISKESCYKFRKLAENASKATDQYLGSIYKGYEESAATVLANKEQIIASSGCNSESLCNKILMEDFEKKSPWGVGTVLLFNDIRIF